MHPLKILLIVGPAAGGMRRHVEELIRRLSECGFEFLTAAPAGFGLKPDFPVPVEDRMRLLPALSAVVRLRALIRRHPEAIIHCHGFKAAMLCALVGPHRPRIVTSHNVWHGGPLAPLLRFSLQSSTAVIAVSQAVARSLPLGSGGPQVLVIPNGVDTERFRPGEQPHRSGVLFLGRLTREKGADRLPEIGEFLQQLGGHPLLVAGDGPLRDLIGEAAQRGVLQYLGEVRDPAPLLRRAALLVAPSLSEGLGVAILEALAAGLPVVGFAAGGIPEQVRHGEHGLLVAPGDLPALKQALAELLADEELRVRMGRSSRAWVEQHFNLPDTIDRLARVYTEVARSGTRAGKEIGR